MPRRGFAVRSRVGMTGLCAFLGWLLASCLQIGPAQHSDAGADAAKGSDAGTASDARGTDAEAGGDLGCIVDPLSRVTLCTSIAICPGLAVDHDRFPHCGFRPAVGLIDIECFCDNFVCPLGATLTCGQARDLLMTQFELNACLQVNEGRCAPRSATPPSGTTCDKDCAATCAGDPGCIKLCGC